MIEIKKLTKEDSINLSLEETKTTSTTKEDFRERNKDLITTREALIRIRISTRVTSIKEERISTITKNSKNKINKILLFTF